MARAGQTSGVAETGRVRLGVRMPPVGTPLQILLAAWRNRHPSVALTLHELNDNEISIALAERALDAAFVTGNSVRRVAHSLPIYREPLFAALPHDHTLASNEALNWALLREQTMLTQGWDDSHAARDLYASFLGGTVSFSSHPASKQSVMALVGAGFGITLATRSQAEVVFPGVVYRPIQEEMRGCRSNWLGCRKGKMPRSGRFVAFMRDEARLRSLL